MNFLNMVQGSEEMMNPRPSISYLRMKKTWFQISNTQAQLEKAIIVYFSFVSIVIQLLNMRKKRRLYKQANYGQIIHDINSINWMSMISDDINDMLSMFNNKIKEIENKHVPMIEVTNKKNYSFSVDKNTRDKIKEKNRLAKKYMRYKNLQDRKKYNTARNKVKSMVAKQWKIFEEKIAANAKDNPKVIYQYINYKSKTRTAVGTLSKDPNNKNSDKMEDDQEKANSQNILHPIL